MFQLALIEAPADRDDHRRGAGALPVLELYTGTLFHAALEHAARFHGGAVVLSPSWGVVELGETLEPDRAAFAEFEAAELEAWADRVVRYIARAGIYPAELEAVCYSSARVTSAIRSAAKRAAIGWPISAPLHGLSPRSRLLFFDSMGRTGGAHGLG